jgi:hypothetical protein
MHLFTTDKKTLRQTRHKSMGHVASLLNLVDFSMRDLVDNIKEEIARLPVGYQNHGTQIAF